MSAARCVLERLLRRAENARLRGADEHVALPMGSAASAAEYVTLRTLEELETFHAEIALAEREGAIVATRDRKRGDGSRLLQLKVADLRLLARHLGAQLLDECAARATALLEDWLPRFPVLAEVLAAWRQGRKVRGCGVEAAQDVADAARVVAAREEDAGYERILRRESVRLFADSKRIETLSPWLEILVTGELAATAWSKEEVWAAIGLRREPQPMLLAGSGVIELEAGRIPLVRPYLGLPVESLRSVATPADHVLTIENLASFHDAARANGSASALLIYTGGMPSPAWRAAYARILRGLPQHATVHHWGDIDEGGFRIAAVLSRSAMESGRTLQPWRMSPSSLPEPVLRGASAPRPGVLAAMCRWAERAGWSAVAAELQRQPIQLEQESLAPDLPGAT